ncbi:MAG TPA: Mth938-like domain-containing protein [Luteimonas sp.]|nr:Mth938-like domain-containing protein [Luteimonas sp.]
MQLTLERPDYDFFLRGADGASALVNERRLERSFIVSPRALLEDWPVTDVAMLAPEDLQPFFDLEPELVLLGSGGAQAFPPQAAMAACLSRGIGIETMTNAAAARTFNVLASEGRRVVAGFVLGKP